MEFFRLYRIYRNNFNVSIRAFRVWKGLPWKCLKHVKWLSKILLQGWREYLKYFITQKPHSKQQIAEDDHIWYVYIQYLVGNTASYWLKNQINQKWTLNYLNFILKPQGSHVFTTNHYFLAAISQDPFEGFFSNKSNKCPLSLRDALMRFWRS